jgi:phospholipase/carboxylesterase
MISRERARKGKIEARPGVPGEGAGAKGLRKLWLDPHRDSTLYIPGGYQPSRPAPLAVMLHGAGGNADHGMSLLRWLSDAAGILVMAPPSRGSTWDIIEKNAFGPDIVFIDGALTQVFRQYNIDPARIAIGGFSDGASYALSVGLTNGDLFSHIIAFSPGFIYTAAAAGKPAVYISHGIQDGVLPIAPCSRRIVLQLKCQQYKITYREFDGPHTVPDSIRKEAVEWFIERGVPEA